jgi:DNA mismatch repair ATPase MutS
MDLVLHGLYQSTIEIKLVRVVYFVFRYLIREIHCFTLFATHFHELSGLAQYYPHAVKNLHVTWIKPVFEKDLDSLGLDSSTDAVLLYKVEKGIGDQSFGIHVATVSDFPRSVVQLATWKSFELQSFDDADFSCLSLYRSSLFDLAVSLKKTLYSSPSCSDMKTLLNTQASELAQLNHYFN